jgi:hypothetical protein
MPHITFIHGISSKPPAEKLLNIWIDALAGNKLGNKDGIDLSSEGVTCSMVYWADVLYDKPLEQGSAEEESLSGIQDFESAEAVVGLEASDPDMSWRETISGKEQDLIDSLASKLSFDVLVDDTFTPSKTEVDKTLERVPLPWFIKRRIMKQFLRDVHHYLFNFKFSPRPDVSFQVRDEIRQRTIKILLEGAEKKGPHIVISHSMGTVIAYDCLLRVNDCPTIDTLITIGSPLGIDEIQDKLKPEWIRDKGLIPKIGSSWVNIYDSLDPVTGFDGNISNDFLREGKEAIDVISESNWGLWRHNITKYLSGPKLRAALTRELGI